MEILVNFEIEGQCIRQSLPDTIKWILLSRFEFDTELQLFRKSVKTYVAG